MAGQGTASPGGGTPGAISTSPLSLTPLPEDDLRRLRRASASPLFSLAFAPAVTSGADSRSGGHAPAAGQYSHSALGCSSNPAGDSPRSPAAASPYSEVPSSNGTGIALKIPVPLGTGDDDPGIWSIGRGRLPGSSYPLSWANGSMAIPEPSSVISRPGNDFAYLLQDPGRRGGSRPSRLRPLAVSPASVRRPAGSACDTGPGLRTTRFFVRG